MNFCSFRMMPRLMDFIAPPSVFKRFFPFCVVTWVLTKKRCVATDHLEATYRDAQSHTLVSKRSDLFELSFSFQQNFRHKQPQISPDGRMFVVTSAGETNKTSRAACAADISWMRANHQVR